MLNKDRPSVKGERHFMGRSARLSGDTEKHGCEAGDGGEQEKYGAWWPHRTGYSVTVRLHLSEGTQRTFILSKPGRRRPFGPVCQRRGPSPPRVRRARGVWSP